jgi:hypothetical protein
MVHLTVRDHGGENLACSSRRDRGTVLAIRSMETAKLSELKPDLMGFNTQLWSPLVITEPAGHWWSRRPARAAKRRRWLVVPAEGAAHFRSNGSKRNGRPDLETTDRK